MSRIVFFIGEGFRALRRSAAPSLAAIVTVGVTMLVVLLRGGIGAFTWVLAGLIVAIQLSRLFLWVGPFGKVAVAVWAQRPDSLMIGMLAALVSGVATTLVSAIIEPIDRSIPPAMTMIAWAIAASASGMPEIARFWTPVAP